MDSNTERKYVLLKGSHLLMKRLGLKSGDYKILRTLKPLYKNTETKKMILDIIKNNRKENTTYLFDGHFLHYNNGKPINVIDSWIKNFSALILINASPKNILKRTLEDNSKKRDLLPPNLRHNEKLKLISEYQKITLEKAKDVSKKFKIPYFVIENDLSIDSFVNKFIALEKKLNQ